ncbi:MAG: hypothetical protein HN403_16765 [Rhodospirillales bacterium]|jgi:hypothetical protein|nr:hypothetical protein [Rhodospirillales bacterium]
MKISVGRTEKGAISIAFGETKVELNMAETKTLLLELTKVLLPGAAAAKKPADRASVLVKKFRTANDVGIQKLLRVADHDDLVALLKFGENDTQLTGKIYGNMSEKSRKIFVEDLSYRFKDNISDDDLGAAVTRLAVTTRQLEDDGSLVYAES